MSIIVSEVLWCLTSALSTLRQSTTCLLPFAWKGSLYFSVVVFFFFCHTYSKVSISPDSSLSLGMTIFHFTALLFIVPKSLHLLLKITVNFPLVQQLDFHFVKKKGGKRNPSEEPSTEKYIAFHYTFSAHLIKRGRNYLKFNYEGRI